MMVDDREAIARYRRPEGVLHRPAADIYPEPATELHSPISHHMVDELLKRYPEPRGAKVLDVGCGQGVALDLLSAAGCRRPAYPAAQMRPPPGQGDSIVVEKNFAFLDFEFGTFDVVWCRDVRKQTCCGCSR